MPPSIDSVFSSDEVDRPYVVAEMACAHEGSLERAQKIVQASSSADAVQIQLFHADRLVVPQKASSVRKFELSPDSWKEVASNAEAEGLDLWATVFDEEAVELGLELDADVLKIHSTDLWNPSLLQACAGSELPISLSVGGTYVSEIQRTTDFLERHGATCLVLMHGFQAFPTEPEDARLGFISVLDRLFPYPVGYQDHTDGGSQLAHSLPLSAMGLGAQVLEKHITDDRSREGTDFESALDPDSFRQFVKMVDRTKEAFSGQRPDMFSEAERGYRQSMKRRVAVRSDIPKGSLITEDVITLLRSDEGIPARKLDDVLGRTSNRPIQSGEVVTEDHLK